MISINRRENSDARDGLGRAGPSLGRAWAGTGRAWDEPGTGRVLAGPRTGYCHATARVSGLLLPGLAGLALAGLALDQSSVESIVIYILLCEQYAIGLGLDLGLGQWA